jgi:hypothetical protein
VPWQSDTNREGSHRANAPSTTSIAVGELLFALGAPIDQINRELEEMRHYALRPSNERASDWLRHESSRKRLAEVTRRHD